MLGKVASSWTWSRGLISIFDVICGTSSCFGSNLYSCTYRVYRLMSSSQTWLSQSYHEAKKVCAYAMQILRSACRSFPHLTLKWRKYWSTTDLRIGEKATYDYHCVRWPYEKNKLMAVERSSRMGRLRDLNKSWPLCRVEYYRGEWPRRARTCLSTRPLLSFPVDVVVGFQ